MNKNNKNFNKSENLEILRKIENSKQLSQRNLAKELGFSLGKLNYCLNALKEKGYIKIKIFQKIKIKLVTFICSLQKELQKKQNSLSISWKGK